MIITKVKACHPQYLDYNKIKIKVKWRLRRRSCFLYFICYNIIMNISNTVKVTKNKIISKSNSPYLLRSVKQAEKDYVLGKKVEAFSLLKILLEKNV